MFEIVAILVGLFTMVLIIGALRGKLKVGSCCAPLPHDEWLAAVAKQDDSVDASD